MRSNVVLLVSFASIAFAVLIQDATHDSLTKLRESHHLVLTAFVSKSLDFLKDFNHHFKTTAEAVRSPLVTVDCDKETKLCEDYDINAFPAVRLFKGNETTRYRGRRTSSA